MPKYCIHNVMSVIKLFKVTHGRHKITPYVDCVTKELRSNPALKLLKIVQKQTFSETNNKFIPSFVKLLCLLSFEVCFCRDILPSFCLARLCTSVSNGIRLKNFAVLSHTNLKFLPLFWLAIPCLLTSLW